MKYLSLIIFVITIPISISSYREYLVFKKGNLIDAKIVQIPNSFKRKSDFLKFELNGKIYDKKVYSGSHNYRVGDFIKLKYLKGYEADFLLSNENPNYTNALLIFILFFICVCFLYSAFKKQRFK